MICFWFLNIMIYDLIKKKRRRHTHTQTIIPKNNDTRCMFCYFMRTEREYELSSFVFVLLCSLQSLYFRAPVMTLQFKNLGFPCFFSGSIASQAMVVELVSLLRPGRRLWACDVSFLAKSLRWKSSVYLINHRKKEHIYICIHFFPERHEEA